MAYIDVISSKREDKFAFLFAGPNDLSTVNYLKDVENVYQTLQTYYNYKPENMVVGYGGSSAPALGTPSPVVNSNDLHSLLSGFITLVDNYVIAQESALSADPLYEFNRAVVLFYFTGEGAANSLLIHKDASLNLFTINSSWLQNELMFLFTDRYDVHILMQQDYGTSFKANINTALSSHSGASIFPCGAANSGGTQGSDYTGQFVRALRFESLLTTEYADELDPLSTLETGREPLLISLRQAHEFVDLRLGTDNPNYESRNTTNAFYLGKPELLIRDSPPPAWWESADIYLTHPATVPPYPNPEDFYAFYPTDPGGNYNYVNIVVWNYGTHPVRQFDVGAFLYDTGPSGAGTAFYETNFLKDISNVQFILIPIPTPADTSYTVPSFVTNGLVSAKTTWQNNQIHFSTQNHRCMRAKAELYGLTESDLSVWTNLTQINNEAQRNLDVKILSSRSSTYKILNPYWKECEFFMILPPRLEKMKDQIQVEFLFASEKNKQYKSCKIKEKGSLHYVEFHIPAHQTFHLKFQIRLLSHQELKEELHFPFEFITALSGKNLMRKHKHNKEFPGTGSFGGFTLVLRGGHSDVSGSVVSREGKPLQGWNVEAKSPDGELEYTTVTAKDGTYLFQHLGFGIYTLRAFKGEKSSVLKDITVHAKSSKEKIVLPVW